MTTASKDNSRIAVFAALLVLAFILGYFGTIKGLFSVWYNDEDYSYGYLIPMITAYLIWERRKQVASTSLSTNWIGGIFVFLFLVVSAYGILGSSPSAVRPAIPLMLLSIALFCFGTSTFRLLFFPLFLLIFMIPLPTAFQTNIGVPLKLVSTALGAFLLRLFSIPVFVQGNVIDLGITQLQVVDACSGLRYILPLLALGLLSAYFFERTRWKQCVLVVITVPIAVITNGIRIGATGVLAQAYGPEVAEGFFHDFSGWLVFMFAFALLFVAFFVLKLIGKRAKGSTTVGTDRSPVHWGDSKFRFSAVVVCAGCLVLLGGLSYATGVLPKISLKGGFSGFPMAIGQLSGQVESIDLEILALSGAEEALNVRYGDAMGADVSLYIGYRGSPFMESANFFHSPSVCLPSSGWETLRIGKRHVSQLPHFGSIAVTEMVIEQMGQRQLVYYWFQTKNRSSHDINFNRLHLTLHAITRDNTYDLFIRPITPIGPKETIEQAETRMDVFVRDMMGALLKFLKERQYEEKG